MPNMKKIVSHIGTGLMVLSLVFIARRLIGDDGFDSNLLEHLTSFWVVAAFLSLAMVEGIGILGTGLNFRAIINNVSGVLVSCRLALAVYTESNMYKYIPGGVMYVAGRNRLAIEVDELSHGKVALSTVLEGVSIIIGVIVIAITFVFEHSITYITQMDMLPLLVRVIGLVAVAGAVILYCFRRRIGGRLNQMTAGMGAISWPIVAKRIGFAICVMFLYGFIFLLILMLMGQSITFESGVTIIGLYLLAWLAGFITPGAPSGIGIREAVLVMFLGDYISIGILAAAMVMHRLLTVIGDVAAYFFAKGLLYSL